MSYKPKRRDMLPLWTDAYLADTTHLDLEHHGAYFLLMMKAWRMSGDTEPHLRDDDMFLRNTLSITQKKWAILKPIILDFWTLNDGIWTQKKLSEIWKNDKSFRELQSIRSGPSSQKADHNRENGVPNGQTIDPKKSNKNNKTDTTIAEAEAEAVIKDPKGSKKKKVKSSWPSEDWRPNPLSQKMKDKLKMSQEEYQDEFDKFRENCKAHNRQYVDWNAAWRTWLQSDYGTYGRRKAGKGPPTARNSGGARNRQHSAGLGGAIERRLEERERQAEADTGYLDLGGGGGPIIDDVPFSTNADPKRLG